MTLANPNLHSLVAFHLSQLSLEQIRGRAVFAPECDGKNRLPLFSDVRRNRETNYCWVDAVIIGSSNTITTVIEVEQSGVPRPSQLGGKLLPIALCRFLHHEAVGLFPLDRNLTFIHVVNSERVKSGSKKLTQYTNIEAAVRSILPIGSVKQYHLLACTPKQFAACSGGDRLTAALGIAENSG